MCKYCNLLVRIIINDCKYNLGCSSFKIPDGFHRLIKFLHFGFLLLRLNALPASSSLSPSLCAMVESIERLKSLSFQSTGEYSIRSLKAITLRT